MSKKKKEQDENTAETETAETVIDPETETSGEEAEESGDAVQALRDEAAKWQDKYMRLAAEYDNYRKRTAGEKRSIYGDATAKACAELLPVADSMKMALDNLKDCDPEILKGIRLVSNQLEKSFEKLGVEAYGEVGDGFDPNLHNAVSRVESDELGENVIAAVYQSGYKIGDRVIRHAMVQVANCG